MKITSSLKKINILLLIASLFVCLTSCQNWLNHKTEDVERTYVVTGSVFFENGAVPSSLVNKNGIERSAFPNPTEMTYKVYAAYGNKKVDATVTSNTFSIILPKGKWIFIAKGYSSTQCNPEDLCVQGQSSEYVIGSNNGIDGVGGNLRYDDISIQVEPVYTIADDTGTVNLPIKLSDFTDTSNQIHTIKVLWTQGGENKTQTISVEEYESGAATIYITFKDDGSGGGELNPTIPAGSYNTEIRFYTEIANNISVNTNPAYVIKKEAINVFKGFETNQWVKSSENNASYFNSNTNEIVIIPSLLNTFSYLIKVGATGCDFTDLQQAVYYAIANNDGNPFRIELYNDVKDTAGDRDSPISNPEENNRTVDENFFAFVHINNTSSAPLDLTIASGISGKVKVDANRTFSKNNRAGTRGGVFAIANRTESGRTTKVTFENIIITGGASGCSDAGKVGQKDSSAMDTGTAIRFCDESGSGETIADYAYLTNNLQNTEIILKDCEVINNISATNGVIDIYGSTFKAYNTLFANNIVVGECQLYIEEYDLGPYGNGAAVYSRSSNTYFENCVFSGNKTDVNTQDGGCGSAVCIETYYTNVAPAEVEFVDCRFIENVADCKGTVFVTDNATASFNNCEFISNIIGPKIGEAGFNCDCGLGGGIYLTKKATAHITDCTITNNTILTNGLGGAVFIESAEENQSDQATFTLSGKNIITENTCNSKVNNIYICDNQYLTLKNGLTEDSRIGVTTNTHPDEDNTPVQFAKIDSDCNLSKEQLELVLQSDNPECICMVDLNDSDRKASLKYDDKYIYGTQDSSFTHFITFGLEELEFCFVDTQSNSHFALNTIPAVKKENDTATDYSLFFYIKNYTSDTDFTLSAYEKYEITCELFMGADLVTTFSSSTDTRFSKNSVSMNVGGEYKYGIKLIFDSSFVESNAYKGIYQLKITCKNKSNNYIDSFSLDIDI